MINDCKNDHATTEPIGMTPIADVVQDSFKFITPTARSKGARRHPRGVRTGFAKLDGLLGCIWPGELLCVTGGPGVGRTSFALKVAYNAARSGARVLVFSLESDPCPIVARMVSFDSRIPLNRLRNGASQSDDWESLFDASNRLFQLDMFISEKPLQAPGELTAAVRENAGSEGPKLLVLDGSDALGSQWHRELKKVACEVGAAALITTPINCACSTRKALSSLRRNHYPTVSILDQLGEAAPIADGVLLLDRSLDTAEENAPGENPKRLVADAILAKSRSGAVGRFHLAFVPQYMSFVDFAEDELSGRS